MPTPDGFSVTVRNALYIDSWDLEYPTLDFSRTFWLLSHFHVRSGHCPMTSKVNLSTAIKWRDFEALSQPRHWPQEDETLGA